MKPHITDFADGYYLVEGLYIVPSEDVTYPVINEELYNDLRAEFFTDSATTPILFRHQNSSYHFTVRADAGTPIDVVSAPFEFVYDMSVESPPSEEQFLLMKPGHANVMAQFSNGQTPTGDT